MKVKYRDCEIEYTKDGDSWCWSILRLSDLLEIDCGMYPIKLSKEEVVKDCKICIDDFILQEDEEKSEELKYGQDLDDIRVTWKYELAALKIYLDTTPGIFVKDEYVYDYERLLECLVEFKNNDCGEQLLEIHSARAIDKPRIDYDIIADILENSEYATEDVFGWELIDENQEALTIINSILHSRIVTTPLYQKDVLLFTLDITEFDAEDLAEENEEFSKAFDTVNELIKSLEN